MSVSDRDRRELYDRLEATLGRPEASTLMELLPPVGWGDVARQGDLVALRGEMAELRGEMAELRGEMAELRSELRGDMAELRSELRGDMAELRSELRGEVSLLRGRVDGVVPRLIAANIASMVGVSGLVLAAGALL